jgi:hypothetical protein
MDDPPLRAAPDQLAPGRMELLLAPVAAKLLFHALSNGLLAWAT